MLSNASSSGEFVFEIVFELCYKDTIPDSIHIHNPHVGMEMMIYLEDVPSFVGKLYRKEQNKNRIERNGKEMKIFSKNGLNMMMMMPWRLSPICAAQRNISTEMSVLRMHKNKSQCCHQQ